MMSVKYILVACVCISLFSSQCSSHDPATPPQAKILSDIERGEYLTKVIGCDHCHTPKVMTDRGPAPDLDRWMMGYPADDPLPEVVPEAVGPGKWMLMHGDLTATVGPWGVSFAANLTPHETGIGNWSFEQFEISIRQGKHKGLANGRQVLPPMPWQSYGAFISSADLEAIFAYLKSIKPIENIVPAPIAPGAL